MSEKQIQKVLIVGAGIMGEGIAQTFAQSGIKVRLAEINQDVLDRCLGQIRVNLKQFIEFGIIEETPDVVMARIEGVATNNISTAVKNCDYIIEAIPELMAPKREILGKIMEVDSTVTIASNTSSFTIDSLSSGLKYPQNVIGVHYFNPAHIIPLVELHRGQQTTDGVFEQTLRLMHITGKQTVLVRKEVPGFIVNRLTGALEREIDYLLDEGIVTPEDLDIAVKSSIGFRSACLGPQEVEDMIGLDTASRSSTNIFKNLSNRIEPSPTLLAKVQKGELGIKSGKGWYDYSGKTRQQVLEERNRLLLQQLKLYKSRQ